jgi:hypothetical protein
MSGLTAKVEESFDFRDPPRYMVIFNRGGSMYSEHIQVSIGDREKAQAFMEYALSVLAPEYEEEERLRAIRYAESDRIRAERQEAERPAREAAAAERQRRLDAGEGIPDERAECGECGHLDDEDAFDVRLYECSTCGTTGRGDEGRRCDQCHKFCARIADRSCPSCEQEVEETATVHGVELDGEFIPTPVEEER